MALTYDLRIKYEDGTTEDVTADQRDFAAYEVEPTHLKQGRGFLQAVQVTSFHAFRWVAWRALTREKRTKKPWAVWSADAVDVDLIEEPADADPGEPTASDASKSA